MQFSDEGGASQEDWDGKWFPKKPGQDRDPVIQSMLNNVVPHADGSDELHGKWPQKKPIDSVPQDDSNNIVPRGDGENDQWHGKWFPQRPDAYVPTHSREGFSEGTTVKKQLSMGILDPACDDTKVKFK